MKREVEKKTAKSKMIKNFLLKKYKESLSFILGSRKYIYSIVLVFFAFSLLGFFVPLPEELSRKIIEYFRKLVLETEGFSFFEMFVYLFKNNTYASFFGMILGVVLGIFSVFNAVMNGFVLGFAAKFSVSEAGILSLWRLFPHGIFELPALFLSLGLGLRIGASFFTKDDLKKTIMKSLRTFLFVIIPLLFVAAIIESALIVFLG